MSQSLNVWSTRSFGIPNNVNIVSSKKSGSICIWELCILIKTVCYTLLSCRCLQMKWGMLNESEYLQVSVLSFINIWIAVLSSRYQVGMVRILLISFTPHPPPHPIIVPVPSQDMNFLLHMLWAFLFSEFSWWSLILVKLMAITVSFFFNTDIWCILQSKSNEVYIYVLLV